MVEVGRYVHIWVQAGRHQHESLKRVVPVNTLRIAMVYTRLCIPRYSST
jgi:hypothetical protein